MSLLIGLAARARSGKDTVAAMLLEQAPELRAYALADPVKMACQVLFGLTDAQAWTDDSLKEVRIERWQRSPRELFQLLGTDWMRHLDAEHWLKRLQCVLDGTGTKASILSGDFSAPELALYPLYGFDPALLRHPEQARCRDPRWGVSPAQALERLQAQLSACYPDYAARRTGLPLGPSSHELPDMGQAARLLIKDVRYENEADFIRRQGGEIWHIVRPGLAAVNMHSSEWGIERRPEDPVILNDGTLEQLQERVRRQWRDSLARRAPDAEP